ncbi:hypothetical protein BC830DRAFT_1221619 [Chytriomyces sp. MP71]|nr:hypothetical protein BC830DRAFT_1221619 [Chytriomyces sp. MP71]
MQADRDVTVYINKTKQTAPAELVPFYTAFEDLYDKKFVFWQKELYFNGASLQKTKPGYRLWHQLTLELNRFNRMNQLSLVQFITKASRTIKDPAQSFAFLNVQVERLCDAPEEQGPFVLAAMEAAHIKLVSGDFEGCKASIDQCDVILNAVTWVQPQVLEIDRSRQSETV